MYSKGGKWKAMLMILIGLALQFPLTLRGQVIRSRENTGTFSGNNRSTSQTSSQPGFNNPGDNPLGMGDSTQRDTNAVRGLVYHKETPDSVLRSKVFMFHYSPTAVKIDELWNPELSPTGVQLADRLDALNGNYYLGKGCVGQPHYAVFPTFADGLVTRLQPDPNEGYAKRYDNIWLYQTMTPYTVLAYHSSLDKDYQVNIAHTQNIRPGWNIAFDYNLICPEGVYTSSGVKNHYLDATTNYFSPDSRLQAAAGIIWQSFNIDENGGIADDTYFTNQLQSNRAGIPVRLYDSGTRHRETAAFARASYNLVQQVDRYRHRDSLAIRTIADTITIVDTIRITDTIHPTHPRTFNAGVLAMELNYDRRKRAFLDSTLWIQRSATFFWTNDAYPDHRWQNPVKMTAGFTFEHVTSRVDNYAETNDYSLFDPFANIDIAIGPGTLGLEGELGLGTEPEHRIALTIELPFDSAGNTVLLLSAANQLRIPDDRMVLDAEQRQNLMLRRQRSDRFEVGLTSGEWLSLMARATHLSHNLWYDTALIVHEGSTPLWLYQAAITARLHAGWFHFDMQQLLQHSTDQEQMPVPLWASKNSIYAELHLFGRALTLQTGADLRYHTAFHAPAYDYSTGLFCHQDETMIGNYIWGDLFVNIQVKRASIYLKAGHLNALWESNPTYFILPHYPGRKFGLYWGITWKFFD
ncbi:MAG: hypothetical protein IKR83_02885 [Bacteroidales bacterium]|nr:hypothetical protein [Bacteroidales bacterium]